MLITADLDMFHSTVGCEIYSSGLLPHPHEPLQSHTNGSVESVVVDEEGDDVDVPTLVGCKSEREDALYVCSAKRRIMRLF